jgi:pyrroline-5-carboxylate reductase
MAGTRKIAILGAGRIGEALLSGLLSSGWRTPEEIVVTTRSAGRAAALHEKYGVEASTSNPDALRGAQLVVVAVKPQDFEALLAEIGPLLSIDQTLLSVAAAIRTPYIEARIGAGIPVVRAMPNSPSTVHEGMAGICAGAHAGVTALSGSGPAYFALLAEAMIEAGILLGVSREVSTTLVVQTMLGTAKQLRDEGMHPVELRESVTSPGGTTIAAIRELEQAGVRAAFLNAIQAAMNRARELSQED